MVRGSRLPYVAIAASALTLALIGTCLLYLSKTSGPSLRLCTRVVDGDTIVLDGRETLRLIGVDTPETVAPRRPVEFFGREATAFTSRLVEGRRVRLEFDQQRRDRYQRTLAYVFLENGACVNAEIIRLGYGHAYTRFPFRRMEEFRALEAQARERRLGLWGHADSGP